MPNTDTKPAEDKPKRDIIWNDPPTPDDRLDTRIRRIPLTRLAALRHPTAARLTGRHGQVPVAAFNSTI
jgi:FXSXX-COOH protein